MIGQCLSNKNKSATISKLKKKLNKGVTVHKSQKGKNIHPGVKYMEESIYLIIKK
jgi:hypothetical protein